MARNTQVPADHNAPAITRILAEYVARHPSRGWNDAVDHEAHRTFLNWLGCAVGAAKHEAAGAAIAAVSELQPAPQATIAGRSERVDMASAALVMVRFSVPSFTSKSAAVRPTAGLPLESTALTKSTRVRR